MFTLLWGLIRDAPLAAVYRELERLGARAVFLDQRRVLETTVDLEIGATVGGYVCIDGTKLDLTQVGAAYLRPHDGTRVSSVRGRLPTAAEHRHAVAVDAAMLCWAGLTPAYVLNRPAAAASNGSKPYQLGRIADAGFAVPETIVTNDPGEVRAFIDRHGDVIYKSVSGIRSRVRTVTSADAGRFGDVLACPTQFQRRVPGTDVRVHVVGAEVYATEVSCDADDYRYASEQGFPRARLAAAELPGDVAARCLRLATDLGLPVAGIDLRRAPDGSWYCFEVNPSPAFTYYQAATGQPMAAAVAALLAAAVLCSDARP